MNVPTSHQIINDKAGKPAYVLVPYEEYLAEHDLDEDLIPHEVIKLKVKQRMTSIRAWREYLGFTQTEIAKKLGISQPAYASQEASTKIRKSTRVNIANALGIHAGQLDF